MTLGRVTEELKAARVHAPVGARERVWRRLQQPRLPPRQGVKLVFAGVAAAAFGALVVLAAFHLRSDASSLLRGDGYVVLAREGGRLEPQRPGVFVLTRGTGLVSTWSSPVTVIAGKHRVQAEAAVFSLRVSGDGVAVFVEEGVAVVDNERVVAPHSWPAGSDVARDLAPVRALEPDEATAERRWRQAGAALEQGHADEAARLFDEIGRVSQLRAEAALVRSAQLRLWQLNRPQEALDLLTEAQARFPHGDLAQEIALSRIEALVKLSRWKEAERDVHDFLARFPDSERRSDLEAIAAEARAKESSNAH
jgi:hypothetical protein